ncbi:GAF domain-containing protein [Aeromicrobium phragmitis]|uniref:GAF domain-containing protein n=1 Tax=Aeromicrobium phragmitis TaxID=2478914 RepID=A0A3L8PU53_9ACTN|nr:GAF domain-containing SpoIIE family protein phosphatase [Aeromicrobium phragmitis]RLV57562.1 GAF domain-containing protein [Aeromicrobium phragmitis]
MKPSRAGTATPGAHAASARADPVDPDILAILHEARRRLRTQTASLLFVSENGTVLEPYASVGLRHTLRAASRVPVGQGFAGRIALSRQPLSLSQVTRENVINPLLRTSGVQSLLGVPVLTPSRLLGVLHVGTFEGHEFSDDDVATLFEFAQQVAAIAEPAGVHRAHDAALILQRSLLPTTPREIGGLETAARYVPAEGDLGGDWYDVFSLPGGSIGFVMGDVVGHGLPAAVIMGRLRSALRAYALDYDRPAQVLERLDRKIRHFEDGAFATVVYAVIHPPFDTITFSSAGHWPPLLAAPGESPREIPLENDPMLGIGDFERNETAVELPAGSSLCFYTDGLVERPMDAQDPYSRSTDQQLDIVRAHFSAADDPETACSRLVANTVGDEFVEDDIALLIVRRP